VQQFGGFHRAPRRPSRGSRLRRASSPATRFCEFDIPVAIDVPDEIDRIAAYRLNDASMRYLVVERLLRLVYRLAKPVLLGEDGAATDETRAMVAWARMKSSNAAPVHALHHRRVVR